MANKNKKAQGIHQLYSEDPKKADWQVFGRISHQDRRGFLRGAGLSTMAVLLGVPAIPYHRWMPQGLIPIAMADDTSDFFIEGKEGLVVLNDRPVNAETPAHLLDESVTSIKRHFVRNNGIAPMDMDEATWQLRIDGLVETPLTLSIDDLKRDFEVISRQLLIECGGNGRAAFEPSARGSGLMGPLPVLNGKVCASGMYCEKRG